MFSTFTGNSRRPRNVNLSGQTGNPFANTSWSPAVVSNATKTVSNAQADREKRQAERLRLKAVGEIQRTWRGHRARRTLRESRRAAFDELYTTASSCRSGERLPVAFRLLLSFFSCRRNDDVQRLILFARDSETVQLQDIAPKGVHPSQIQRLVQILVETLHRGVSEGYVIQGYVEDLIFESRVGMGTYADRFTQGHIIRVGTHPEAHRPDNIRLPTDNLAVD